MRPEDRSQYSLKHRRAPTLALIGLLGVGCTVGPDYEPPVMPSVPDAWKSAVLDELEREDSPLESWWVGLNDPLLSELVERAATSSLTLQAAAARVQEARALLGIAGGFAYPDAVLDAAYSRSEPSENGQVPVPEDFPKDLYQAGVGFAWEIDVFGRIRRGVEAATANLEASIEDYRDVLVVLLADVASNYVSIRTLQTRIDFARANVDAQRETLKLTQDRFDAGLTSARDVAQAESNLANSEASIPLLEARLEAAYNRLSILLGEPPGAVDELVSTPASIPQPNEEITTGLPAELLRRRPDIRRAERRLAAQTALIGAAKADLYPTFSLSGVIALESTDAGNLVEGKSTSWSLVPGLRWNIFSGGKIRSQVRAEEARTDQALLAYEQTVLLALGEVEDTMVALEREKVRREKLQQAVAATERTVQLVRTQYLSGLTDFQSYLDAQRSLFGQQDALAGSEGQVVQSLIALNRALGGGWSPPAGQPGAKAVAKQIEAGDETSGREE